MQRIQPGPGQESVWDYPRPPRVEECTARLRVVFGGRTIADTERGLRVLETSHPPVYYLPRVDILEDALRKTDRQTFCEWKGVARYFDVIGPTGVARAAAWDYVQPVARFAVLVDHVAFYAHAMDACYVDQEQVQPQAGSFYGGWITSHVVGPFKGPAGTRFW